MTLVAAV